MTSPIGPISGFSPVDALTRVAGINQAAATQEPTKVGGTDFAGMLSAGLESVQAAQTRSSDLQIQLANGTLADPAQYTMASTEAALGLQLTMAIRNKAVEAFQEIMRMQA